MSVPKGEAPCGRITGQEKYVIQGVVDGKTNAAMADELHTQNTPLKSTSPMFSRS